LGRDHCVLFMIKVPLVNNYIEAIDEVLFVIGNRHPVLFASGRLGHFSPTNPLAIFNHAADLLRHASGFLLTYARAKTKVLLDAIEPDVFEASNHWPRWRRAIPDDLARSYIPDRTQIRT